MGSEKHEKKEKKQEKKEKKKKDKSHKHKKKKSDKKDSKKKDSKHIKKHSKSSSSSSSDDDGPKNEIGPAMPPGIVLGGRYGGESADAPPDIGPALPPGIVLPSSNYVNEEDSDDEAGPSAQPADAEEADTVASEGNSAAGPNAEEPGEEKAAEDAGKRKKGPSLPAGVDLEKIAAQAAKVDWQQVAEEEEEEEEDLVGPAMPGQVTRGFVAASMAAEQRALSKAIAEHERALHGDKPHHEEWMTALPDVKALGFTIDQMQQNRTFHRKETQERGDTSAWTDTPADKDRKAREKALGIKRKTPEGPAAPDTTAAAVAVVQQYNAAVRPKSLVELHKEEMAKKQKTKGGAQGVTPGGWDRSEISQTRQKDAKSADKMFQDAQTLGGRFGGGSFHGI